MRIGRPVTIALALSFAHTAYAADMAMVAPARAPVAAYPAWTVTVGVEGFATPLWEGADRFTGGASPIFDIRQAGTPARFRTSRDGFGFAVFDIGSVRAGPVGKLRYARDEGDDPALRGLGDIDWTVELGGFIEYWPAQWLRLRGELRHGIGGHDGLVSDLMADLVFPVSPQLTLSAGPRLTLASSAATDPYFSITPAQSVASGLPVFDAGGGLRAVGAGAQARYQWSRQWATHVFVEYDRLQGDAASSPLVSQRGTANQWTFGGGVTYEFDMRAWW